MQSVQRKTAGRGPGPGMGAKWVHGVQLPAGMGNAPAGDPAR